jgi:hypothetical protein
MTTYHLAIAFLLFWNTMDLLYVFKFILFRKTMYIDIQNNIYMYNLTHLNSTLCIWSWEWTLYLIMRMNFVGDHENGCCIWSWEWTLYLIMRMNFVLDHENGLCKLIMRMNFVLDHKNGLCSWSWEWTLCLIMRMQFVVDHENGLCAWSWEWTL